MHACISYLQNKFSFKLFIRSTIHFVRRRGRMLRISKESRAHVVTYERQVPTKGTCTYDDLLDRRRVHDLMVRIVSIGVHGAPQQHAGRWSEKKTPILLGYLQPLDQICAVRMSSIIWAVTPKRPTEPIATKCRGSIAESFKYQTVHKSALLH